MTEWTDDLRVRVDPERTLDELVDHILDAERHTAHGQLLAELTRRFALSGDDARLAIDRVHGGVVRAATSSPANEPSETKDPVAHRAFMRTRGASPSTDPPRRSAAWETLLDLLDEGHVEDGLLHVAMGFEHLASRAEFDAAGAWRDALTRGDTRIRALGSVEATRRLVDLSKRSRDLDEPRERGPGQK